MTVVPNLWVGLGLFFVYGLYAASTESISKAWISNISKKSETATAIGTFTAFNSIFTMLASVMAGLIWEFAGPAYTFGLTALASLLIGGYFILWVPYQKG